MECRRSALRRTSRSPFQLSLRTPNPNVAVGGFNDGMRLSLAGLTWWSGMGTVDPEDLDVGALYQIDFGP